MHVQKNILEEMQKKQLSTLIWSYETHDRRQNPTKSILVRYHSVERREVDREPSGKK